MVGAPRRATVRPAGLTTPGTYSHVVLELAARRMEEALRSWVATVVVPGTSSLLSLDSEKPRSDEVGPVGIEPTTRGSTVPTRAWRTVSGHAMRAGQHCPECRLLPLFLPWRCAKCDDNATTGAGRDAWTCPRR